MGGWFLSFAIANFLGGQIAALTGVEGHGAADEIVNEASITGETTVREAIESMNGTTMSFEDWKPLSEGDPINISVQKYTDIRDWVEFRSQVDNGGFDAWKNDRSMNTKFASAEDWLDVAAWERLGKAFSELKEADKKVKDQKTIIDYDSWIYFRDGFAEQKSAGNASLSDVFKQHKMQVLEKGLNKYVDVFSTIGYLLVAFSVLIAVLSKPLNKLMHGVK